MWHKEVGIPLYVTLILLVN